MAARFNAGASIRSTRYLSSENPKTGHQGHGMRSGIPGYIKTKQDDSSGGLASSKTVPPRFTHGFNMKSTSTTAQTNKSVGSFIGKRGSPGVVALDKGKLRGSSDKSYRATSMGPPGRVASSRSTGSEHRGAAEHEGAQRGKPRGGSPLAGKNTTSAYLRQPGSRGKMESLRGRALTSAERR